jgi:adenine/guanine phosphoribosyltransferase-like PRPP-binding protein
MHTRKPTCWRLFSIISVATFAVLPAKALDSVAEFYRGKQITVIVGSSAGGG